MGTHCYILTLNGAKILVDKISRLNYPIDKIISEMLGTKKIIGYKSSQLLVSTN